MDIEELRIKARAWIETKRPHRATVAATLKISQAMLSQFLGGIKGLSYNVAKRLEALIDASEAADHVRETQPVYNPMRSPFPDVAARLRALAACLDNEAFTEETRLEELASSAKALFDGLPGIRDAVERFKISRADD
jgi:hypothetical protein